MAEISTADLEKFLAPKGPTARAMHLRNLETFWRWASAPPRNWANIDTLQSIEKPRVSNDTDIRILSPDDVKALLQAAEIEGAAAAYAIAIFGGVRMAELERLKWGDIHEEYIEIGKSVAKKHSRRLVPICPTLAAWIGVTRGVTKNDDPVVPSNWTDLSKSVRRRAGWDVAARLLNTQVKAGKLEKVPEPTRGKWPANACRHTCASVQVAIGTPVG
jgi:integrase